MEQDQIESKLKIEGEITALKREYKYALENLTRIKSDTNDILGVKERALGEIAQRNIELTKVLNEISDAKLKWSIDKQAEITALDAKRSETDNILNKKQELDNKEREIAESIEKNTEIRNEARQLELKNERTKLEFESKEKEIELSKKEILKEREKFDDEKSKIISKVANILEEITKL